MISIILYVLALFVFIGGTIITTLLLVRARIQKEMVTRYKVVNPNGVDVLQRVKIGDTKQWLHIRGRNRDNPVLLFLHGGPGYSHIGWYDEIQRSWEEYFTVVQWDQRMAGKSYLPEKKYGHTVTNEQLVADAENVILYLREHLGKGKIFLMGWSYGTYLGMKLIKRHPEWFYAYVSVGQTTTIAECIREEHSLLLNCAKEQGDKKLIKKLQSMLPYPDPNNKFSSLAKHADFIAVELSKINKRGLRYKSNKEWLGMSKFGIMTSPHYSLWEIFKISLFVGPHSSKFIGFQPGHSFFDEFIEIDLPTEVGSKFDVPIFFFSGAHNWHVPYTLSDDWFKKIEAPYKEQIWFNESAHFAQYEEAGKFLVTLVSRVLPMTQENCDLEVSKEQSSEVISAPC